MTWLTITEYLCHKWTYIYSFYSNHNPALSMTRVTRGCHMRRRNCLLFRSTWSHPRFFVGFVLLDLYFPLICFVDRCFSFCHFNSFLFTIVLYVLLRFTASDYLFGIFKLVLKMPKWVTRNPKVKREKERDNAVYNGKKKKKAIIHKILTIKIFQIKKWK